MACVQSISSFRLPHKPEGKAQAEYGIAPRGWHPLNSTHPNNLPPRWRLPKELLESLLLLLTQSGTSRHKTQSSAAMALPLISSLIPCTMPELRLRRPKCIQMRKCKWVILLLLKEEAAAAAAAELTIHGQIISTSKALSSLVITDPPAPADASALIASDDGSARLRP
jgi:hypothetical protein